MKTETHYKLALMLCDRCFSCLSAAQRKRFILGCVEPDINPFSYLRGFKTHPFFGHDWPNAKSFIVSSLERLSVGQTGSYWFGVLTHYLCDAFTNPHNSGVFGGVRQHTIYEKRLHSFVLQSSNRLGSNIKLTNGSLVDWIVKLHNRYEKTEQSFVTDADFIISAVQATSAVFERNQMLKLDGGAVNELCCAERYTSRP